jgi:hypothetical protein
MLKSFAFKSFALGALILSMAVGAIAQNSGSANGVQPFESQTNEISLDTLNIHLDIPIVDKAGVGLPFSFALHYNSNFWYPGPCVVVF